MNTTKERFKAVLFDLDGTLLDTEELILDSHRFATEVVLGHAIPRERIASTIGQPLVTQMEMWADRPDQVDELVRVYREHNEARHDEAVLAFPGVLEMVRALKETGLRMGVVTSKKHALAWHGLELFGLDAFMELLIGSDDCSEHKPAPGPVLKACEQMGLDPAECLYVGDSPFDLHAGRLAGCATAAVTWGVFALDKLLPEQPSFVVDEPAQVLALPGVLQ